MAIGLLALLIGFVFLAISGYGIGSVDHPVPEEKAVAFPYPEEL